MKFELERGSIGYIKKKKTRQILLILIMLLIAAVMFIAGLFLNKFNKANLCTVLAILMVLPAAKFLVTFVVLFPFKTVPEEKVNEVNKKVCKNAIVMTDMVITSPEKVMNLDFVIITDNQVMCLMGKKQQDILYIENYLKKELEGNKIDGFTVKVFDDDKQFDKCLPDKSFDASDNQDACFKFIRTFVV